MPENVVHLTTDHRAESKHHLNHPMGWKYNRLMKELVPGLWPLDSKASQILFGCPDCDIWALVSF